MPNASMLFGVGMPLRKDKSKVAKKRISIEAKHRMAVQRKHEKVAMLEALVDDLEPRAETAEELEELRKMKVRLRSARTQLAVMRP